MRDATHVASMRDTLIFCITVFMHQNTLAHFSHDTVP